MKSVLITGANRGIGLGFTQYYLARGYRVFAATRAPEKAQALNELKSSNLCVVSLDLSHPQSIDNLSQELAEQPLDIIISNAGMYGPKKLSMDETKDNIESWKEVLAVNCIAPFLLAQAFKNNLALGSDKKMVFLSSKMGSMTDNTSGGSYIYRSSKAALNAVVKSLSHDLSSIGCNVCLLHPGWVKTTMGGPNALISVEQSVAEMCKVIDNLSNAQSGQFINFDGKLIPW
ncbi:SDR family oxidoreductase [Catenovulum sp. SM1970]|uniref:SDR family oxidoreductase n=1 Tax=Marinifaba aquimaris TaxID=2741323 RepID=UPI001573AF4D|nr:SDR family oxidoreductase [Marinifaba aquimaris]NTS77673.1 SDR family oxidoreductase [Marinifaba aquimaris]